MGVFRTLSGRELAVDLGTANSLVFVRGEGVVVFEPSVVAVDDRTGKVYAVGEDARRMIGRTPATIRAIRPLRHGVITDFETTEEMLRYFIRKVGGGRLPLAHVVLCVPSGITKVERQAVEEATLGAGARAVYLVEEPMAAAVGAGLPVADAQGSMVVDIGGGTTEVAVISLGGIVSSQSIKVGGYEMDEAVAKHVQSTYGLLIGEETAEQAKLEAGSAWELEEELDCTVAGRDLQSGMLRRIDLGSEELRRALSGPVQRIVDAVRTTLEATPPELAADVSDRGIVLAGGGALLRGIDSRLADDTGLHVARAESPLTCVVLGAGAALDELESLKRTGSNARRGRRKRRFGAR
ncbi:MAG TPA: rod shape-determining protein [Gaiellaceae bacterium]|nr:rod shape-determining protein [Gaiellaceae bacterium]